MRLRAWRGWISGALGAVAERHVDEKRSIIVAMSIERLLAAIALAVCAVLLVRLAIGARRRARLDALLYRVARALRGVVMSVRHRREAARVADEAIKRARERSEGEWDGNVYKPKSFRKPPRDKMH